MFSVGVHGANPYLENLVCGGVSDPHVSEPEQAQASAVSFRNVFGHRLSLAGYRRGACRQPPLDTGGDTACVSLPLFRSACKNSSSEHPFCLTVEVVNDVVFF